MVFCEFDVTLQTLVFVVDVGIVIVDVVNVVVVVVANAGTAATGCQLDGGSLTFPAQ